MESDGEDMDDWYRITLNRLIDVCRTVASKYTRSKVRKALPKDFEYIIDELLHTNYDDMNKEMYYANIIDTIININRAEEFIVALANLIKRMAVDRLHIVGDVFDRGPHADVILDRLMEHHSVDLQWGNHDVLWMGAACGSDVCIAIALKNSLRYNNLDIVENAYGINLLPLAMLATETYHNVEPYAPKGTANMSSRDRELVARMHKAIFIIQLKLEGQLVRRRPEFNMADRDMLSRINYADMTIEIDGETHRLMDTELPTVDPKDPTALSPAEAEVVRQLRSSFEKQHAARGACALSVWQRQPVPLHERQSALPRRDACRRGRQLPCAEARGQKPVGEGAVRLLRRHGEKRLLCQRRVARAALRHGFHVVPLVRKMVSRVRAAPYGDL